jgi:hypothetical protein
VVVVIPEAGVVVLEVVAVVTASSPCYFIIVPIHFLLITNFILLILILGWLIIVFITGHTHYGKKITWQGFDHGSAGNKGSCHELDHQGPPWAS